MLQQTEISQSRLNQALQILIDVRNEAGTKKKLDLIRSNSDIAELQQLLWYAFHPQLAYNVSEATLKRELPPDTEVPSIFENIFDICEFLAARKAADDATVFQVLLFLQKQPEEHRDLYRQILSKTLRIGLTAKNINKVIPGLIPEWEVQQAFPIEKYPLKPGVWFAATQKLNGIRATYHDGRLVGRSGSPLQGLQHIVSALNPYRNYVFDGELTLADPGDLSDNEAFRTAAGIINSDKKEKPEIIFTIFDMLPIEQFEETEPADSYKARRALLNTWAEEQKDSSPVKVLPLLYAGTEQEKISELLDQMVRDDKEGLMINLDVPYQRKRHKGILKVKRFYTMDLPIVRCEKGSGRLSETLGALVVDYMGNEVGVGSGFTDEQRDWFWSHREEVVGQLAEVKYKEVSTDKKTGEPSLQFPVFVQLRTDKSEVSFG